MKEMKEPSKKPLIYYYLVALLILFLFNAFLTPTLLSSPTQEVSYSAFLDQVDAKQVDLVEFKDGYIYYTLKDDNTTYYTGQMIQDFQIIQNLRNAGATFTNIVPREMTPLQSFLTTWVFPLLFFIVVGQLLSRWMMKRMNGGGGPVMTFGGGARSGAKVYVASESGITFDDVAGEDEAKEALTEIVDFLHDPSRYRNIGARLPKGALLVGPPGTGKTLLAKAVAGEARVPFFSISGSEFVEMFVGMGAAKVRDLFKQAGEKAPCIVFIDEIDTIGKKRDSGPMGGNDEREQTLNQLLTEMDGFDSGKGVVILAATNRPDSLDPALLRPGRFDRRIPVELPDLQGREAILRVHAAHIRTREDIDYGAVARATAGASGAELANIVNEAALRAVRMGRDEVSQEDLEESVEVVIAGYQRKNAVIPPKEKEIVAYHETGHALVAALQKHSAPVHKITIIPRTSGALGYTMQVEEGEQNLMSREEILDKIATFTGGRAAEELIFGTCTSGASNDIEQATRLARAMVTRLGMTDEFGMVALETVENAYLGGDTSLACSAETAAKVDAKVVEIVKECRQRADRILRENREKLCQLAKYLLEKETITGEEFMKILDAPLDASPESAPESPETGREG
jgi:cell division protease FtsH